MAFAEKLQELMDRNNIIAANLSKMTGISTASISDYLKGKKEPRGKQSVILAKALHISLDTLWETEFDPEQNLEPVNHVSIIQKEAFTEIKKLDDNQIKSVLAFINSLNEVEKIIKKKIT